jgi:hypothetical protein
MQCWLWPQSVVQKHSTLTFGLLVLHTDNLTAITSLHTFIVHICCLFNPLNNPSEGDSWRRNTGRKFSSAFPPQKQDVLIKDTSDPSFTTSFSAQLTAANGNEQIYQVRRSICEGCIELCLITKRLFKCWSCR